MQIQRYAHSYYGNLMPDDSGDVVKFQDVVASLCKDYHHAAVVFLVIIILQNLGVIPCLK